MNKHAELSGRNADPTRPRLMAVSRKKKKPSRERDHTTDDLTVTCAGELPPLIPEGEYEVGFLRAEKKILSGEPKLFLWFKVVTLGEGYEKQLYMACNYPKRMTPACKFYKMWVLAEGRRPKRHDRMNPSVFKNKMFHVRIRTVWRGWRQQPLQPELRYSVIDDIIKKTVGA